MLKTIEAIIDEHGVAHLLESVNIKSKTRVLVVVMDEKPTLPANETSLVSENMSEQALAKDRDNDDEHAAWSYLR